MSVDQVPHRPDHEELEGARKLGLTGDDQYANVMLALARRAFEKRSYGDMMKVLKGLVISRPDDPRIYEAFGILHQAEGRADDARRCFETAYALDRETIVANVNLGELAWRKQRDATLAKQHLDRVLKRDPNGPFGKRALLTLNQIDRAKH
jgi:tetratricopeptide (TPR) repeat protein